ncbi:MAG: spore germination protein GerW family protein [Clostridiales bacterium]|nr:spore germination protein GerW family protein [Clostridiales bacterium]
MANPIKELIESTINSLDGMFTSESILGETVTAPDGTMIIPMSRVSFGVGGGGCEFKETNTAGNNLFGGGVGAGATVKPEGFLVITKMGSVRFVSTNDGSNIAEKLVDYAPELIERITDLFKKKEITEE